MDLPQQLKKIGFSDKEAQIYLRLVHQGPQGAADLSLRTEINRTSIYDILEGLKRRGLIQTIQRKGRTLFQALHPKELINFLEREKRETVRRLEKEQAVIQEILPALISLEHVGTDKPKVTFFEGEKGMREAYEDTLTAEGDILALANIEEMHKALPHFFPEYYKRRAEHQIHIKAIFPDNPMSIARAKRDREENRESILVPQTLYNFSPELNIYNNKVLTVSWREKLAILIESKEIADLHRSMYNIMWQAVKK